MFKKFFILLIIFIFIICYINSFSKESDTSKLYCPIKEHFIISSTYGYRDVLDSYHFHNGLDYAVHEGTSVFSTSSGVITYSSFNNTYGNMITILHDSGYKSLYGHLSDNILVKIGDYVSSNQLIGYVGPRVLPNGKINGMTTGPHLHFSIFDANGNSVDPANFEYI